MAAGHPRASTVLFFFTSRHHASEIIDRLLEHRKAAPHDEKKLVKVSDAASKNFSHYHGDQLEEAVCSARGRLKFRAVKNQYPEEYAPMAKRLSRDPSSGAQPRARSSAESSENGVTRARGKSPASAFSSSARASLASA